jgi:hypothetical protein
MPVGSCFLGRRPAQSRSRFVTKVGVFVFDNRMVVGDIDVSDDEQSEFAAIAREMWGRAHELGGRP